MGDRFNTVQIHGKLANISGEVARKANLEDGTVKSIIGGDVIQGERKNEQPFDFKPYCRLIVCCNSLPHSADNSSAFFRRWVVVPFDQQIPKSEWIRNLDQILVDAEGDGILAWSLQGLARLQKRGRFDIPDACNNALDAWRSSADPVKRFCDAHLRRSEKGRVLVSQIMDAFNRWSSATGGQARFTTTRSFRLRLEDLGLEVKRTNRGIDVRGYELLPYLASSSPHTDEGGEDGEESMKEGNLPLEGF